MAESKQFTLNQGDVKSMAIGLAITAAGAALTYLADVIIPNLNFGVYGPAVVPALALVVNAIRKYVSGK